MRLGVHAPAAHLEHPHREPGEPPAESRAMTSENGTRPLTRPGMLAGLAVLPPVALIGTREEIDAGEPVRAALLGRLDQDLRKSEPAAHAVLTRAVIAGYASQPAMLSHHWRDAGWWVSQSSASPGAIKQMAHKDICDRRAQVLVDLGAIRLLVGLAEEECSPRSRSRLTAFN